MSAPEEHRLDAKPPPLNRWARLLFIDESRDEGLGDDGGGGRRLLALLLVIVVAGLSWSLWTGRAMGPPPATLLRYHRSALHAPRLSSMSPLTRASNYHLVLLQPYRVPELPSAPARTLSVGDERDPILLFGLDSVPHASLLVAQRGRLGTARGLRCQPLDGGLSACGYRDEARGRFAALDYLVIAEDPAPLIAELETALAADRAELEARARAALQGSSATQENPAPGPEATEAPQPAQPTPVPPQPDPTP